MRVLDWTQVIKKGGAQSNRMAIRAFALHEPTQVQFPGDPARSNFLV